MSNRKSSVVTQLVATACVVSSWLLMCVIAGFVIGVSYRTFMYGLGLVA